MENEKEKLMIQIVFDLLMFLTILCYIKASFTLPELVPPMKATNPY